MKAGPRARAAAPGGALLPRAPGPVLVRAPLGALPETRAPPPILKEVPAAASGA